jgi:hypothetical protein
LYYSKQKCNLAIYIGVEVETPKDYDQNLYQAPDIPYFYLLNDSGVSFWGHISSSNLKSLDSKYTFDDYMKFSDLVKLEYQPFIDKRTKPVPVIPNWLKKDVSKSNIFKSMEVLSDCILQCKDGRLKTSRFLLATRSEYFLTFFQKYSDGLSIFPLPEHKRTVVESYLRYIICGDLNKEEIKEDILELIDFGNYIQDFIFVELILNSFWKQLEEEDKEMVVNSVKLIFNK